MKYCFIIGFYPDIKGGAEYQSKLIANELTLKYNHEVFFISYGHKVNSIELVDHFKVYKFKINNNIYNKLSLYNGFIREIEKILKTENPDLVYQRILNTISFRLSKICLALDKPLIIHIADLYSISFQKSIVGLIKKIILKRIVLNKTKIVVQTKVQADILNLNGFLPDFQIYNSHPIPKIYPNVKKNIEIFWIGSFRAVKQLELYIDLAGKFSDDEIIFNIIGRNEQDIYCKNLLNLISKRPNIKYFEVCRTNSILIKNKLNKK